MCKILSNLELVDVLYRVKPVGGTVGGSFFARPNVQQEIFEF